MKTTTASWWTRGALCALLLALPASAATAQGELPDTFRNLKVLPRDIQQKQLIDLMRSFTGALGVRCPHCHVGEEGKPLSTFDFASDEKAPKRAARDMLRMVEAINGKYLAKADLGRPGRLQVQCVTCHHGLARPEPLPALLARINAEKGTDAALEEYKALRQKYYGGAQYDFGVQPLNMLAERLVRDGRLDDALKAAELNADLHPEAPHAQAFLGDLFDRKGDRSRAIEAMRRALAADPGNGYAAKRLAELEKETPARP